MNRSAIWAGSLVVLFTSGLLVSCASNPKKMLSQQTGIVVCRAAVVKSLASEHGDVFRFDVSAKQDECDPSLSSSIIKASKGDCRGLIDRKGSCSYAFGHRTVIAENASASDNVSRYEVRSW